MPKKYTHLIKPLLIASLLVSSYLILNTRYKLFVNVSRLKTQDLLFRIRYNFTKPPKETGQLVLIAIDDKAYDKYGGKWPWEREAFAALIYNINKDKPKVIGLNLAFLGRVEEEEADELILKIAFEDAGNVIGASYFEADGRYIVPNEFFASALKDYGFTNKPVDKDKVIRNVKYFEPLRTASLEISGVLDYSLEIKLLSAYYNIPPEKILEKIPIDKNGLIPLNFTVKPKDLNIIPVLDVLENKAPPGTFKDKIVLLGTTGKIFHDENSTPLGPLSGIEVIANSVIMLLSGRYLHVLPSIANLILFILIIGLLTYCFWRFWIIKNIFILFGSLTAFMLFSFLLVLNNIITDFLSIPAFILISYLAVEGTKYGTLIMEEMRLKNMAILDPATELGTRRYFMFRLDTDLRRAVRERRALSVALFNIDNFEQISSSYGVDKSESILKRIGQLIKKNSRKTRHGDFIARYGENIFGVILRGARIEGARRYVSRLKTILEQQQKIQQGIAIKLAVSSSAVSLDTVPTESATIFLKYAENSLAKAKEERDRISIQDKRVVDIEVGKKEPIRVLGEIDLSFVAEELNEKNKELREMIQKLRTAYTEMANTEKLSAMGKLASSIHHELNNPLSALRTCLQSAYKSIDQQQTKSLVNSALEEVQRMIEMNKGLKELYKPTKVALEPVNINKILDEILSFIKGELNKKKIELVTKLDENIPDIEANKGDLKQVFLNIILNATDAMPRGGKLYIETQLSQNIEIKITDTGCGILPENMEKIFKALFTTKEEGKGAGLGLYVTKQKIEQHGGNIKVTSQVNQGTTFTISLPR